MLRKLSALPDKYQRALPANVTGESVACLCEANANKQEMQWKSAVAECAELAGTYRNTCMAEARAKYGR